MERRALVIAGPTASGKSGLALAVAKARQGMVINADSMQVYRDLTILTARPNAAALAQAPHRLYGVLGASEVCSAARWVHMARDAMEQAWGQGRMPILVGGTGLYLRALIEGLADIPPIPEAIRDDARSLMASLGARLFYDRLAALDPRAVEGLRPSDSQRLTRAYEVRVATGRPLSDWHIATAPSDPNVDWRRIALVPDRGALHDAINRRFQTMVQNGALDEARHIQALGLDPSLPLAKVLGLRPLMAHVDGTLSLDEAVAEAQAETRRYAKRQMTWLRTQMMSFKTLSTQDSERNFVEVCTFLDESP